MKLCGVYKITCTVNTKFYIGSSKNILERWKQHISELENGKHVNRYLQNCWNIYGVSAFRFEILELTKESERTKVEQAKIIGTKCYTPDVGFNICKKVEQPPIPLSKTNYISAFRCDTFTKVGTWRNIDIAVADMKGSLQSIQKVARLSKFTKSEEQFTKYLKTHSGLVYTYRDFIFIYGKSSEDLLTHLTTLYKFGFPKDTNVRSKLVITEDKLKMLENKINSTKQGASTRKRNREYNKIPF